MKPYLQITRSGMAVVGSRAQREMLRRFFEKRRWVRLPSLLEPGLLRWVRETARGARFTADLHVDSKKHYKIALEDRMARNAALIALQFLANTSYFFEEIRTITGCGKIGTFNGRVYRMSAERGHYDSWHDDIREDQGRMVAMSVNLSARRYRGGALQIRCRKSQKIIAEIENPRAGDAVLFRLSDDLEHRLTPMRGGAPRTAFAGWFQKHPSFVARLRRRKAARR